ncbi:MAG: M20/M25/M40 family metallo-hydrolase [Clostridia bacterium]|nr:M20/M25/M40 family metallo-hydrolase [Clostridia bacterium]
MMVLYGVIVGLMTAEYLIKSKRCNGIIKVPIYACEESSRFGHACIGSKYLNGDLTEDDFDNIVDKNDKSITLRSAIEYAKSYLFEHIEDIQEVDKIFDEVDYSLEAHIEQYDLLKQKSKKLFLFEKEIVGIITSIGSAVRVKYDVQGKLGHTGSTPMKKRRNAVDATSVIGCEIIKLGNKYEKKGLGRASQIEINTPEHKGSFNQLSADAEGLIDFRLLGDNKPESVLKDFGKIVRKAGRKTRTKINTEIISSGTPVTTSSSLNSGIASICERLNVKHLFMPSYPGQDTGYIPAKNKTMIFIPSTGGSHNPAESTKPKYIETATKIYTDFSENLLLEHIRDRLVIKSPDSHNHSLSKEHSQINLNTSLNKSIKERQTIF